eukprot:5672-Heterococcus_DN1.PRE.2
MTGSCPGGVSSRVAPKLLLALLLLLPTLLVKVGAKHAAGTFTQAAAATAAAAAVILHAPTAASSMYVDSVCDVSMRYAYENESVLSRSKDCMFTLLCTSASVTYSNEVQFAVGISA